MREVTFVNSHGVDATLSTVEAALDNPRDMSAVFGAVQHLASYKKFGAEIRTALEQLIFPPALRKRDRVLARHQHMLLHGMPQKGPGAFAARHLVGNALFATLTGGEFLPNEQLEYFKTLCTWCDDNKALKKKVAPLYWEAIKTEDTAAGRINHLLVLSMHCPSWARRAHRLINKELPKVSNEEIRQELRLNAARQYVTHFGENEAKVRAPLSQMLARRGVVTRGNPGYQAPDVNLWG